MSRVVLLLGLGLVVANFLVNKQHNALLEALGLQTPPAAGGGTFASTTGGGTSLLAQSLPPLTNQPRPPASQTAQTKAGA